MKKKNFSSKNSRVLIQGNIGKKYWESTIMWPWRHIEEWRYFTTRSLT